MVFSDRIGNVIALINQGRLQRKSVVVCARCNSVLSLLNKLQSLGFIYGYSDNQGNACDKVHIYLKYTLLGEPVLHNIVRISRPSKRVYINKRNMTRLMVKGHAIRAQKQYGYYIVTTSKGLATDCEVREKKWPGGEIIRFVC